MTRDPEGAVWLGSYKYKGKWFSMALIAESRKDAKLKFRALGGRLAGLAEDNCYEGFPA